MRRDVSALVSLGTYLVPYGLSRSTTPSPDHPRVLLWYSQLDKPSFQPPDIAFPLAWVGIESGLACAAYRLLRKPGSVHRTRALGWLAVNVVAIGAWSRLFFGGRSLPSSTLAAAAMVVSGTAFVVESRHVDRPAAAAGLALTAWVSFATVLTAVIWRRNR